MEEHELRIMQNDGVKAKVLLEDETFKGAFNSVRSAIFERWEACSVDDRTTAHELKLMLKLLGDLKGNLQLAISQGNMAGDQLKIDKKWPERIKDRLRIF